jgi:hypothetical protein
MPELRNSLVATHPSLGPYLDLNLNPRITRTGLPVSDDLYNARDQGGKNVLMGVELTFSALLNCIELGQEARGCNRRT